MGAEKQKKNTGFAHLRSALLNWYPFVDGARALLLGDDTVPLLPLLQKHYAAVDTSPASDSRYDCIVAVDRIETESDVPAFLRDMSSRLADDGVFLLVFRNRFGIKYLCGGVDEYSGPSLTSLQPVGSGPRLYAKNEVSAFLGKAGFAPPRFYYLMPDADFIQAVYTDDFLPNDSIRDRVFPFDLHSSPLIAWEGDLYDDLVRERLLPFAANVYVAECRKASGIIPEKQVVYAALSTDREDQNSFATVLYSDGTGRKIPLSPKGMKTLQIMCANAVELEARGISIVSYTIAPGGIEMPFIREEGSLRYLRRQLPEHPEAFVKLFDLLYQDVLRSSPAAAALPDDPEKIWGAKAEDLGPILRSALIDMIPYNAFWADGKLRYYDQEFRVEDCPAKYVLFRALFYTWLHIPEAEQYLPLESMKARYGLLKCWDGFRAREARFVSKNRRYDALKEIYEHAGPDRAAIRRRRAAMDDSVLLSAVHTVQMELLQELDRVCSENGLRYMAIHGTLLGAVRHHGFIPWDDDVDVAMPRKDYDALLALGKERLSEGFFLQTPANSYGCFYGGYAKLRRDGTLALEPQHRNRSQSCHQGVWIDIFPLDNCPREKDGQKRLQKRLSFLQRIIYAKTYSSPQHVLQDVPGSRVSLYYLLARVTRRRWLTRWIDNLCRKQGESGQKGILACYYGARENKNIWPAEAVANVERVPFESMMLPIPCGWDALLRARYGKTYYELPPVYKRYRHDNVTFVFDPRGKSDGNGRQ